MITPQGLDRLCSLLEGFTAPVVGNYYASNAAQRVYTELLGTGGQGELILEFEPTNKYDINSVAVWTTDHQHKLGHIDRRSAQEVSLKLATWLDARDGDARKFLTSFDLKGKIGMQCKVSTRLSTSRVIIEVTKVVLTTGEK